MAWSSLLQRARNIALLVRETNSVRAAAPRQKLHPNNAVIVLRLSGLTADEIAQLFVFLKQNVPSRSLKELQGKAFLVELAARICNSWQGASSHPELSKLESVASPAQFLFLLATR
jgi:hypothetical protein